MHIMVRDVSFLRSISFREVKISLISLNAVDLVKLQSKISPFSFSKKVALNPLGRIFLNFAKRCILSC